MSHLIDEERRQEVLKRIDEVVFQIASQLLDRADQIDRYERMADEAPRRPNAKVEPVRVTVSATTERDDDLANTVGKGAGKPSLPTLQFPTRAISGVQRFAQYLRVLELVQLNLVENRIITKRSIFYQCLHLFGTQQASDRIIEQVVRLLGCRDRSELGITATPRGLFAGWITIRSSLGAEAASSSSSSPSPPASGQHELPGQTTITSQPGITTIIPSEIGCGSAWSVELIKDGQRSCSTVPLSFVLIVEKEAAFKTLVQLQTRHRKHTHREQDPVDTALDLSWAVIVTARGYPDHATCEFLNLLCHWSLKQVELGHMAAPLAFLGLFDADPYGIDIHRVYRRSCPRANIQWLGMELQDFLPSLNLNREPHSPSLTTDAPEANTTLIPLKPTERTKALSLLAKLDETRLASLASQPKPQPRSEPQVETTWRHMLGDMLQHGLKVEIEAAHSWNRVSVDQGQSGDLGLGLGLGLEGYLHHRWRLLKAQESSMK